MNPEEIAALKDLIEFLQQKKIGEFRLERGELKMELRFEAAMAAAAAASSAPQLDPLLMARLMHAMPAAPAVAPLPEPAAAALSAAPPVAQQAQEILHTVRSPIVGTFYGAPSPGSPAFVKVGDQVEVGQPLCIVEAMKLMNEIESDVSGEIVEQLVSNGHPVEYNQPLFAVRPR